MLTDNAIRTHLNNSRAALQHAIVADWSQAVVEGLFAEVALYSEALEGRGAARAAVSQRHAAPTPILPPRR